MDGAALVAKVFDAFDRSADGYLDRDELFEFFSKVVAPGALLRQLKVETIAAAAEALLKRADADGDGAPHATLGGQEALGRFWRQVAARTASASPWPAGSAKGTDPSASSCASTPKAHQSTMRV